MRRTNQSYIVKNKETNNVIEVERRTELDPGVIRKVKAILDRGNDVQLRVKKGNQVDVYELKVAKEK